MAILASIAAHAPRAFALDLGPETTLDAHGADGAVGTYWLPSIGCGTNHCVIAWTDPYAPRGPGVVVARVDAGSGAVLDLNPRWIGAGFVPNVACSGDDCIVAWASADRATNPVGHIHAAHIDADRGTISGLDLPDIVAGTSIGGLDPSRSFACGTGTCLVSWLAGTNSAAETVWAARIDAATGACMDPGGFRVSRSAQNFGPPHVGCDGARCLVLWADAGGSMSYGRRVDLASGAVVDATDLAAASIPGMYEPPFVSCSSGVCMIAWTDIRGLLGRRVSLASGSLLDTSPLVILPLTAPSADGVWSIDCTGNTCVLGWTRWGRPDSTNMASRVRIDTGEVVDGTGVTVSSPPGWASGPSVACAGTKCVTAWIDRRSGTDVETFVARFDASTGTAPETFGVPLATGATRPALSCIGGHCVVAWQQFDAGPPVLGGFAIYGASLASASAFSIASAPSLLVGVGRREHPSLACIVDAGPCLLGATDYLGQTEVERVGLATGAPIDSLTSALPLFGLGSDDVAIACEGPQCLAVGQRADAQGNLTLVMGTLDPTLRAVSHVSPVTPGAGARSQAFPAVACDTSGCAVAWQDMRNGTWDLFGTRVDPASGARLDPADVAISAALGDQTRPRIACQGGQCVVVWQDTRNQLDEDIYLARWNLATGSIDDPAGVPVATGSTRQQLPSVGCASGNCWLAWQALAAGDSDALCARIDLATAVLVDGPGVSLAPDTSGERGPTIASISANAALVSYYRRGGTSGVTHVYARTVGPVSFTDAGARDGTDAAAPPDGESASPVRISGGGCGCETAGRSARGERPWRTLATVILSTIIVARGRRRTRGRRVRSAASAVARAFVFDHVPLEIRRRLPRGA